MKNLYTKRLTLRPWKESDADSLYKYAKHPDVGPVAGWPVHESAADSLNVIKNVLSAEYTYAVTLNGTDEPIGSIGLLIGEKSNIKISDNEGEIGYWIGVPYWGQGLIPEGVRELMRYAFEELGLEALWCGYFDGNTKSKHAQEKCGFKYNRTNHNIKWELMNDIRTEHITRITKSEWTAQNKNNVERY